MRTLLSFFILLMATISLGQFQVTEYDNLVYTQASGYPQTLDLFVPNSAGAARPAIVFVHGGGWSAGDKTDFSGYCSYYAAMGYVCATINYRLAPQHVWPAQIDDTQAAVRWMRRWASVLNLDPKRVGAVGASAGGHLVLFLGEIETLHDFDPALTGYSSKVEAVADYYGPTDFTHPREWNPAIWQLIEAMLGTHISISGRRPAVASPLFSVTAADAPTVIFQGDADPIVPVDQSRRIVAKKEQLGDIVDYYEFPGEGHGFSNDPFWISVNAITSFFAAHL